MRMKSRSFASLRMTGALVSAALMSHALPAQRMVTLGKPAAETRKAFTRIESVRELRDRRVLIVDQGERSVELVDFRTPDATTKVGRLGSGPGEYGFPGRLVALPGDTS